jgi:hypothetical protein
MSAFSSTHVLSKFLIEVDFSFAQLARTELGVGEASGKIC